MQLYFVLDPATDPLVICFLQEHLDDMRKVSPPESVHALDVEKLRQPDIRFWTAWMQQPEGPALVGTCALKQLDAAHVELKTMRVQGAYRGSDAAQRILAHVLDEARASGVERISLETGTEPFFTPARRFYARNGFELCEPFGSYQLDPHSCFMTRAIR
ncbi:GNAT family N-acetyltransferase [Comamonas sp. 4034]